MNIFFFLGINIQRHNLGKNRYTVAHFLVKIYFCRFVNTLFYVLECV